MGLLLFPLFVFAVWQVHPWLGIAASVWIFMIFYAGGRS
jgi:hypothetical protein